MDDYADYDGSPYDGNDLNDPGFWHEPPDSPPQPAGRYRFIYDTSVSIDADSKEEADQRFGELEGIVESHGASLVGYDAYGILDAETGEELRPIS